MGLSLLSSNERGMDQSMKNEDGAAEKWIAEEDGRQKYMEGNAEIKRGR